MQPGVVAEEARALAALRGGAGPKLEQALVDLTPHLERYAELVVAERGIEIIAGGCGDAVAADLARIAQAHGAPDGRAFLACARRFPDRMLGLKLCFGDDASPPTLYVRTLAPVADVLAFVESLPDHARAGPALDRELAANIVVYGLGFSSTAAGAPLLKTYSLDDVSVLGSPRRPGFVSLRAVGADLTREVKRYLPDVEWSELPRGVDASGLRALVDCGRVGHLGVVEHDGRAHVKLYLERIGAIPSDLSAR